MKSFVNATLTVGTWRSHQDCLPTQSGLDRYAHKRMFYSPAAVAYDFAPAAIAFTFADCASRSGKTIWTGVT